MSDLLNITVILNDRFEEPKIWRLEVPRLEGVEAIAEFVFELSNAPPQFLRKDQLEILERFPRTGLRSISVGDIILIDGSDFYAKRPVCILPAMPKPSASASITNADNAIVTPPTASIARGHGTSNHPPISYHHGKRRHATP